MKKLLFIMAISGAFLMLSTQVKAQDPITSSQALTMGIPEVLLINAVNAAGVIAPVTLELTTTTAGNAIAGGTGTSRAQVSSIVASGQTRTITAAATGVPAGTALSLTTIPPSTGMAGILGSGSGDPTPVSLVNGAAASIIVTGIGSCYTGNAAGNGYILNWFWDAGAAGAYGTIFATGATTATVVLTISAGAGS